MLDAPKFRFWVRRSPGEGAVYSIRFEVDGGKGLLRVARPGVLVDPPAREFGFEERLTSAQVRASRFLHVWEGGRKRQGYVLSRLTDAVLAELPLGSWEELSVVNDGGFCWLVHRAPEELDANSLEPLDLNRTGDLLRDNRVDAMPADLAALQIEPLEVEPLEADADDSGAPMEAEPAEGELVEDGLGGPAPAGGPEQGRLDAGPVDVGLAELETLEETADELEPVEILSVEPMPGATEVEPGREMSAEPSLLAFGRSTALVRHLRRDKLRDLTRIAELTAELERSQKALDEAMAREAELRVRLASYQQRLKARESVPPQ